jgi:hypothetical protein
MATIQKPDKNWVWKMTIWIWTILYSNGHCSRLDHFAVIFLLKKWFKVLKIRGKMSGIKSWYPFNNRKPICLIVKWSGCSLYSDLQENCSISSKKHVLKFLWDGFNRMFILFCSRASKHAQTGVCYFFNLSIVFTVWVVLCCNIFQLVLLAWPGLCSFGLFIALQFSMVIVC